MPSHEHFAPADWGEWRTHPLSFLIDAIWQLADLVRDEPFPTLHGPWLLDHSWGISVGCC